MSIAETAIPAGIEILDRIARIMDDESDETGVWRSDAICERIARLLADYGRIRTCPACSVDHAAATTCPFTALHDGHWRGIPLSFPNDEPDRFDELDVSTWFAGYVIEVTQDDETLLLQAVSSGERSLTGRRFDLDTGRAFGHDVVVDLDAVRLIEIA